MGWIAQYTTTDSSSIGWGLYGFFLLGLFVLYVIGAWMVYEKAGEKGWKALIPFYNWYILLKIVGRPGWWLILFFIPIVSFVIWIVVMLDLSKSFGKGVGFAIGLIFLNFIFLLILGFGDARYQGPAGAPTGTVPPPPLPA